MVQMIKKIDHIAVAVHTLKTAVDFYKNILQLPFLGEEVVAGQKVKLAMFDQAGVRVELLEPTDPSSPIARFLEKRGEGLHHICYEVYDIKAAIADFKAKGARIINEIPTIGAHNTLVAFLHPKNAGHLIELNQYQGADE